MISNRTKDALKAAKAGGQVLGGLREAKGEGKLSLAERADLLREASRVSLMVRQQRAKARAADLGPILADLQAQGVTSLNALAQALTQRGIPTARGVAGCTGCEGVLEREREQKPAMQRYWPPG